MNSSSGIASNAKQINPTCDRCVCHTSAKPRSVCLRGRNSEAARRLVVFTDYPDYFANNGAIPYCMDTGKILDWLFARMSVDPKHVSYEYTLRCYAKDALPSTKAERACCIEECAEYRFAVLKRLRPSSIAVLGQVSLEAFTGKTQIGSWVGQRVRAWEPVVRDYSEHVWVGYSLQYILVSPSDTPGVFRVLFQAAHDAGLNPRIDPTVPPYHWRNIIF